MGKAISELDSFAGPVVDGTLIPVAASDTLKAATASQLKTYMDIPAAVTVDSTPTDGSSNAVSSNGVFDALAGKADSGHNHSGTYDPAGTAATAVGNHVAATDPHGDRAFATSADAAILSSAQAYADSLVVGLVDDRGNYNASGNTFPASGGSGAAGAVLKGDLWTVSVAGALGGVAVAVGDQVRALVNAPGQTAGNWAISEANIGYVPVNSADKDTTGGFPGLSGFSIKLKNALGTVTSLLASAATATRTWTFPDKDGTVAMLSDITGTNSGTNTGDQDLSGYSLTSHNHSGTYDPAGTATSAMSAHTGAADPHAQYALESTIGAAGGIAPLDGTGKVASSYLPSYVDDVIEAANYAALPGTGETGKIYVTLDDGKTWRWGGSSYTEISPSPGTTDAVPEGSTNLYHTAARVLGQVLTGLSTAAGTVVTSAHTILQAIGFLQKQVSDNATAISGKQATLVSGTNIKTINSTSLLGSGNLSVSASPGGSATQVQYNNAGVFAGASGITTTGTELAIASGTKTTSKPVLDLSQTWNAGGVTFTGIKLNVTDTASASGSILQAWQVGGTTKAWIDKQGSPHVYMYKGVDNNCNIAGDTIYFYTAAISLVAEMKSSGLNMSSDKQILWPGTGLKENASGVLEVNNQTAGTYRDLKLRNLVATGNLATGVVTKTANYTATTSDHTITVDAFNSPVTITGFACSGNAGKRLTIKKIDSGVNAVTFDPNASETVDGDSTKATSTQYRGFTVQVNDAGTAWFVVATF